MKIVFEGFADQEPGWEFDMPVWMVKPAWRITEHGNARGGAERVVEGYLIDWSVEGERPEGEKVSDYEKRLWRKARRGKGKLGRLVYWRQVVVVPDEQPEPDDDDGWDEWHQRAKYAPMEIRVAGDAPREAK